MGTTDLPTSKLYWLSSRAKSRDLRFFANLNQRGCPILDVLFASRVGSNHRSHNHQPRRPTTNPVILSNARQRGVERIGTSAPRFHNRGCPRFAKLTWVFGATTPNS